MKTIQPNTTQLRMLASVKSQQWLMNPNEVQNFALAALEAEDRTNKADSDLALFYDMRKPMSIDADGIAHIEIKGSLLYNCPPIYEKLGLAVRYETIINEVKLAEASGAKGILYNVNSPGGTVAGVIEASEIMKDSPLPSSSYCSGMACSAGYWLACSTDTIIASPSAQVGNVGAIISWQDCSAFWADQGIEFKALVSEGADYKSTFYVEPNADQIEFLQESIDESGKQFRDHVSASRADLDEEVFKAGWYSGERAGELGLIDAIATYEEAREDLLYRANLKPL